VHDLAGNVAEWTSTLYRPYPYRGDEGREDLEVRGERVTRGRGSRRLRGLGVRELRTPLKAPRQISEDRVSGSSVHRRRAKITAAPSVERRLRIILFMVFPPSFFSRKRPTLS
jgi:hypothetical protein